MKNVNKRLEGITISPSLKIILLLERVCGSLRSLRSNFVLGATNLDFDPEKRKNERRENERKRPKIQTRAQELIRNCS